jgi:hypothetical protein
MGRMTIGPLDQIRAEMDLLRKCCSQRGARMQVLRDCFPETLWERACIERPEMRTWFDRDGVPRDTAAPPI